MNRHDGTLQFISVSRPVSMNFDDDNEPRRAINYESEDQKLAPSNDLNVNGNDVLCGRGKTSFNHVGNRRFRHIISESIEDYNNAGSRKAKSAVVKRVHDVIRATGGRFLKMDATQRAWVELAQQRSLEKVSHAIRDATSTNETMKVKKTQVKSAAAHVAAHVECGLVPLERKMGHHEDASEERVFLKPVESFHTPSLPAVGDLTSTSVLLIEDSSSVLASARLQSMLLPLEQSTHPPCHPPLQLHVEDLCLRISASSASASAKESFAGDALLQQHVAHRRPHHPAATETEEKMPPLNSWLHQKRPQYRLQTLQQETQDVRYPEDNFLSYINEVLGPVSPTDLDIDPLKVPLRKKEECMRQKI